jgi:hypothetical protein
LLVKSVVAIRCFNKKSGFDISPIIIGGAPRSGTTLIRSLVGKHPQIACPQSEVFIFPAKKNMHLYFNLLGFSQKEALEFGEFSGAPEFSAKALKIFAAINDKPHMAIKAPIHNLCIEKIFRYFPNARYIHVIRDGRDVACSLRHFPKRIISKGEIQPVYSKNPFRSCIKTWKLHVAEGFKGKKFKGYFEVKYEDAVTNLSETMKKVFDRLNLPSIPEETLKDFFKDEIDDYHIQSLEVGKPLYNSSVGRWKTDMSEKEKRLFQRLAGDLSMELGYE